MRYLVSYDLHNHRDYTRIHSELHRLGATKILLSMWGIQSSLSVIQLRNHLQRFVDHDDTILVHDAPPSLNGWASYNLSKPAGTWLGTRSGPSSPSVLGFGLAGYSR